MEMGGWNRGFFGRDSRTGIWLSAWWRREGGGDGSRLFGGIGWRRNGRVRYLPRLSTHGAWCSEVLRERIRWEGIDGREKERRKTAG